MKKLVLFVMLMGLSAIESLAGDYKYLVFKCPDVPLSIPVDGLEMTVSNGKLVVTNSSGRYDLDLSTLSGMFFSEDAVTGVGQVAAAAVPQVSVCDLSGRLVGTFSSQEAARQVLPKGVYVVKQDGKNFKMAVKRNRNYGYSARRSWPLSARRPRPSTWLWAR